MPVFPESWNPEVQGSRFTMRPALVVLSGEVSGEELQGRAAREAIETQIGDWILAEQQGLGTARVVDGGIGRGAEGWAPVLEWVLQPAVAGVVGAAAWEATRVAARQVRQIVDTLKTDDGPQVFVSRGMAALVAVQNVLRSNPQARLALEAVEEPSSIAGHPSPELNYVGVEPWIVSLVDPYQQRRFIVAVSPDGIVRASMELKFEELEGSYSRIQPTEE